MLNTKKLLYIFPDVAYVADLLEGKKEHTFSIQNFRQINGEFLDDNEFIPENIEKLIKKLDPDNYHLVLPDFIFTNTVVEIEETSEAKIKDHIKSKLLPDLGLSKNTHELKTFILTEHGGKAKVQLSALEKSVMNPVSTYAGENKIEISGVSPLSWTVKSVISLEPSISILQMGSRIYLAQQYIGVDQTISDAVDEVKTLAETIKTLKGAEPSIQTVYLITNSLVEENLKEILHDTLPLQQLASFKDEDSDMPSYIKQIIESGMKTLSVEDYSAPTFPLSKPTGPVEGPKSSAKNSKDSDKEDVEESSPAPKIAELDTSSDEELPKPTAAPTPVVTSAKEEEEEEDEDKDTDENEDKEADKDTADTDTADTEEEKEPEKEETAVATDNENMKKEEEEKKDGKEDKIKKEAPENKDEKKPSIVKNKSGVQPMIKMVLITVAVFFATVAIGVGVGIAFISLSQKVQEPSPEPSPAVVTQPSPSPSPSPSPEPEIEAEELSILVVNATTIAGYAGETGDKLEEAGVGSVRASNAKGDYDEGIFVLMKEENQGLISFLEEATEFTLEFSDEVSVEDSAGAYDAVIVLAE